MMAKYQQPFFKEFLRCHIDKVTSIQEKLALLEDPQVELHLLQSCLSSCKIIHPLRTVPFVLQPFLCHTSFKLIDISGIKLLNSGSIGKSAALSVNTER